MTDEPDSLAPAEEKTPESTDESRSPEIVDDEAPPAEFLSRVSRMMMGISSGPSYHPIFEKFKPEHVDKFLDHTHQDAENAYRFSRSNRWFHLTYTGLGLGAVIFLIVFLLPTDKALLVEMLKAFVFFAGGLGSGYGLKSYRDRHSE